MNTRSARWLGAVALVLLVVGGATVRIQGTLANPRFDAERPEGQLMSETALIYYMTERVVDAGGWPPADFRADPRVEHPELSDLPAMFTVGQEFFIAWCYLLLGGGMPLHLFCVFAMGVFASLAVVGVYGLTRELSGSIRWALFAAVMYTVTRANYRTLGFILEREDVSLPFIALHLWLLARAVRLKTPASSILAGLALVAAVSTWHAMGFVVAMEAAAIFLWFFRTGQNPMASRSAWPFALVQVAAALIVPVLRSKLFLLSLPMQAMFALWVMARVERRRPLQPLLRVATALGVWALALGAGVLWTRWIAGDLGDYEHVFELMWAKVRFLGQRPVDPQALSFDARLLWQGPFRTADPMYFASRLGILGVVLVVAMVAAARGWIRGIGEPRTIVLATFALFGIVSAVLVHRLVVLCGLLAPVFAALLLVRWRHRWRWMLAVGALQIVIFAVSLPEMSRRIWYMPENKANLVAFFDWAESEFDGHGAVAADYVNSSAILAHTGHAIALQPKYETSRTRRRIERFATSFFYGSPADLHRLLVEEFDCRYLLVDGKTLWGILRYPAGMADGEEPAPGTAAFAMLPTDTVPPSVPGFRIVYCNDPLNPTWWLYELE